MRQKQIGWIIGWLLTALLCTGRGMAQSSLDFYNDAVLQEVRFDIFPADWQKLKANYLDNTYYPCDMRWKFQGKSIEVLNIGIRSRGVGSRSDVKPGLRVDFNRYETGQTFLGLKSFVLRNNSQDASMLRERLSMLFFQRMGYPASREAHARFYVNDEYIGLYTLVESVDKDMLKLNFGENDGYLYKYDYALNDAPYRFEYRGSNPALYSPKPFSPETHETDPNPAPLEAMIRTMNQATDAEFLGKMADYLDLRRFMGYVGIENFLVEQDGMLGEFGMNNYYLYRFEKKLLSTLIPWDASNTFFDNPNYSIWRGVTDVPADRQNVLMRRCIAVPELRNAYLETIARSAWQAGGSGGYLEKELDRAYAQIRTAAYEDVNKQCLGPQGQLKICTNEEFEAGVEYLLQFIRNRSNYVRPVVAQEITPVTQRSYSVAARGAATVETVGRGGTASVGYGRIQADSGSAVPAGLAIFGFRQNNVLVTEAGVPASPLVREGRIYAEVSGPVNTGLAIANPNSQAATLSFYFTDGAGRSAGTGTLSVPANSQSARFLSEAPFNAASLGSGTLTFSSTQAIAVRALRGYFNERSEFLLTTLPMAELTPLPIGETAILPHFVDGAGWTSQVVLINPSDQAMSGSLQFLDPGTAGSSARPLTLSIGGRVGGTFDYVVPGKSARRFQNSAYSESLQGGSVRVLPAVGQSPPYVTEIFSYLGTDGITVTEAGVPAGKAGMNFRLYVEVSGNLLAGETGSVLSGVAIANPASSPATAAFELFTPEGRSTGLKGSAAIPANGQIAQFLSEIQGLNTLLPPFKGILRVSTTSAAGLSVIGLRGRQNERGDFLITTTPPVDESQAASAGELFFPQLVDGGGYTTQMILYSGAASVSSTGVLRFVSQTGQSLGLVLW